jgi:hypothetical protein
MPINNGLPIGSGSGGEDSALDGTEKFPVTGSKWALVSSILEYIRTATSTFTNKTLTSPTINSPTIATPTVTGAITLPDNVRQTFNPGADAAGLNVGAVASDPGTPSNGDMWYDSGNNTLDARINGATVSLGSGSGDVTAASTFGTDNRAIRSDGTGKGVQSSGITIDDSDNMAGNQGTLYNFKGAINTQTGTTYATVDGDNGKIITLSNGSAITLTVHQAAAAGFNCLIIQLGAGQVTVAAGGTGNVRNRSGHTKLAGQYGMGSIFVVSNAGTAPEVYLAGDTGT